MDLSRRFFLGGAISLIAAQTFVPSVSAFANIPTIYGDGIRDDSGGIQALFRNDPVIFDKDSIGVDKHQGIQFHKGDFVIDYTVEIPKDLILNVDSNKVSFNAGKYLDRANPFFDAKELNQYTYELDRALYLSKTNRAYHLRCDEIYEWPSMKRHNQRVV